MRWSRSRRVEGSIPDRFASISRFAPRETANSSRARTTPAAMVSSPTCARSPVTCGHDFGAPSHSTSLRARLALDPVQWPTSPMAHRRRSMRRILAALLLALAAPAFAEQGTSRGAQLFRSGDWVNAKAELSADVRRNPLDASAHFYLGRLALVEGDLDAALEQLKRAVELQDVESDYHLWYGKAMTRKAMQTQDPLLAMGIRTHLERAVALDGRNVDARDALADFYSMAPAMMGGGADKAREQAEAIARLDAMRGHFAFGRL